MKELSEYDKQAISFLKSTGTEFTATFQGHKKHFIDDSETRDVYSITLKRGSRSFTFNFGQSIWHSCKFKIKNYPKYKNTGWATKDEALRVVGFANSRDIYLNDKFEIPSAYDVLACLTKYNPGTLEDFCSEFGYDPDSKKAEKIYVSVLEEFKNVAMLWNDQEIEILQEIQ